MIYGRGAKDGTISEKKEEASRRDPPAAELGLRNNVAARTLRTGT